MLLLLSSARGGSLQQAVEVPCQVSLNTATNLSGRPAFGSTAPRVLDRGGMALATDPRDGKQCPVQLSPPAVESVADSLAAGGRDRAYPGKGSEGCLAAYPPRVGPGDEDLSGRDRANSMLGKQGRCEP